MEHHFRHHHMMILFFYIRYPTNSSGTKNATSNTVGNTAATATTNGDINTLTKALKGSLGVTSTATGAGTATSVAGKQKTTAAVSHGQQHIDFSKHTEPCKKFISGVNNGKVVKKMFSNQIIFLLLLVDYLPKKKKIKFTCF